MWGFWNFGYLPFACVFAFRIRVVGFVIRWVFDFGVFDFGVLG